MEHTIIVLNLRYPGGIGRFPALFASSGRDLKKLSFLREIRVSPLHVGIFEFSCVLNRMRLLSSMFVSCYSSVGKLDVVLCLFVG